MRYALVLVTLLGCGGEEELTCELLADPGNCWAEAAQKAADCIPLRAEIATLSADRKECVYSDGVVVEFDTPLPMTTQDLTEVDFEVNGNGCSWKFQDTFANRMSITDGQGRQVISELHPDRTFHVHCPSGETYESSFDLLFTCQPPSRAPTDGFEVTPTSFTFSISAVTTPGTLIQCAL